MMRDAEPTNRETVLHQAALVGGTTLLSMVAVGQQFRFPRSDAVNTKLSATRYRTSGGQTFTTGRHVAVIVQQESKP